MSSSRGISILTGVVQAPYLHLQVETQRINWFPFLALEILRLRVRLLMAVCFLRGFPLRPCRNNHLASRACKISTLRRVLQFFFPALIRQARWEALWPRSYCASLRIELSLTVQFSVFQFRIMHSVCPENLHKLLLWNAPGRSAYS